MARDRNTGPDLDMLAAALLISEGRTQVQIAETLGISQAAVSRYLAEARSEYLQEEIRFLENKLDPATLLRVRQRADRSALCEMLSKAAQKHTNGPGPLVRVFSSGSASADWETRLAIFARNAAPYLRQLILRSRYCGLTWGKTVGNLVQACRDLALPAPWSADRTIEVVPLNGEPLGDLPNSFSSSTLCEQLGIAVNGPQYRAKSLSMIPAFVPDGFSDERRAGVEDLIDLVESYREIFGSLRSRRGGVAKRARKAGGTPLVERLDMILTSVGPAERPMGHGSGRLAETGNLDINGLRKVLLGDVGGVCVGRDDFANKEEGARARKLVDGINARWTGIHREDIEAVVREARSGDPATGNPGLVIAAISSNKARVLFDIAVKRGLANILLLDEDCEQELARLVRRDSVGV